MKAFKLICGSTLIFFISHGCQKPSDKASIKSQSHEACFDVAIPDSNTFLLKRIGTSFPNTSLSIKEVAFIKRMPDMDSIQVKRWLVPLCNNKLGDTRKLVSFQGQTANAFQYIIANIFDIYDEPGNQFYSMEQYLVSISKSDGKLIGSVRIQAGDSGDEMGETYFKKTGLILNRTTTSELKKDTVTVHQHLSVVDPPDSHDNKDVTKQEVILKWVLQPDGRFVEIK